jgi:hypothetical protein
LGRFPRKYSKSSWGNQQLPESLLKQAVASIPNSQATLQAPCTNLRHVIGNRAVDNDEGESKAWKCSASLSICGKVYEVREALGVSQQQAQQQAALNALHM